MNGAEIEGLVHTGADVAIISPKSWHPGLSLQGVNILYKILKGQKKGILPNSFYETTVILIPKAQKKLSEKNIIDQFPIGAQMKK